MREGHVVTCPFHPVSNTLWCYYRLPYKLTEKSCRRSTVEQESRQDRNQLISIFTIHSQLWPQIQNTLALSAHLAFWDKGTEAHLICSERHFTWQRNIVFKLFPKWNLLGDSEGGFELWSPRPQSWNLITSYFGKSTSASAGAIPLCINSARKTLPGQLVAGEPLHSLMQARQKPQHEPQLPSRSFHSGVTCYLTTQPFPLLLFHSPKVWSGRFLMNQIRFL